MKLRELLQTELWSKRTTRKILIGFGSLLVVAVMSFGVWYGIERYWLTSGERIAAKAALAELDAAQGLDPGSNEFDRRAKLIERLIDTAEKAAKTDRDENVATLLSAYSYYAIDVRSPEKRGLLPSMSSERRRQEEIDAINAKMRIFSSTTLHKVLD